MPDEEERLETHDLLGVPYPLNVTVSDDRLRWNWAILTEATRATLRPCRHC